MKIFGLLACSDMGIYYLWEHFYRISMSFSELLRNLGSQGVAILYRLYRQQALDNYSK